MDGLFTHLKEVAQLTASYIPTPGMRSRAQEQPNIGGPAHGDIADVIPIERAV